jgi:hypothetical protein
MLEATQRLAVTVGAPFEVLLPGYRLENATWALTPADPSVAVVGRGMGPMPKVARHTTGAEAQEQFTLIAHAPGDHTVIAQLHESGRDGAPVLSSPPSQKVTITVSARAASA